ncbi:MAG: YuiB family protein [Bacilli bacterium]
MSIPVALLSAVLFFVLFYGIGFLFNMILRTKWAMLFVYPFAIVAMIDGVATWDYVFAFSKAVQSLQAAIASLTVVDLIIFASGLVGCILAGLTMGLLRKRGYQMF